MNFKCLNYGLFITHTIDHWMSLCILSALLVTSTRYMCKWNRHLVRNSKGWKGTAYSLVASIWQMHQYQQIDKWKTTVGMNISFDSCFETKIKLCIDKSNLALTENVLFDLNRNFPIRRIEFYYSQLYISWIRHYCVLLIDFCATHCWNINLILSVHSGNAATIRDLHWNG